MMLAGILIGLLPMIFALLVRVVAPRLVLPGVDFYFLTLILIPVVLAQAVGRRKPAVMVARM
jgi:hypothetical protein